MSIQVSAQKSLMPSPQELHEISQLCQVLGTSKFYSQNLGPAGVLAIWLSAREMNLPPMMCLNGGMHNIEGKITLSAQVINLLITSAGHRADVLHLDEKSCKIRFWRYDRKKGEGDTFDFEYTIEMAQKAGYFGVKGLNDSWVKKPKANWLEHPRDMLYNRCLSGGGKKFLSDVLGTAYIHGEIEEIPDDEVSIRNAYSYENNHSIPYEEPLKIEYPIIEKCEGYDQFYTDMLQNHGQDFLSYIDHIKKNKPTFCDIKVVNMAVKNKEKFLSAIDNWKKEKQDIDSKSVVAENV